MKLIFNILLAIYALFVSGCTTFQIVDLKHEAFSHKKEYPKTNISVGLDTLQVSGRYTDAEKWQQGLAEELSKEGFFKKVSYPYQDKENFDLIIRGEVRGDFRHHGAKNFFTWWPGPFIFAPNWRGTRYYYDANADIELIDVSTGKVIGNYHAETSHELIHKSASPGHFLAAPIMIPGIVKGAKTVSPNGNYRQQMYKVTYPSLWAKISKQIVAEENNRFLKRLDMQRKVCGEYLDEDPEINQLWTEFETCQSQKYKFLGNETGESGTVQVFMSSDSLLRIHVSDDGRILKWFIPKRRKRIQTNIYTE